jgi:hypothetical protein
MSMSEWTNVPAEVRQNYACKVCSNYPDEEGVLDHGRGCYMIDENGGGSEYIEMDHPTPAPLKPLASGERSENLLKIAEGETAVADKAFAELCAVWQIENTPLRQSIFRAGARHSIALIAQLKSHGMPDDAEPGEWLSEMMQVTQSLASFKDSLHDRVKYIVDVAKHWDGELYALCEQTEYVCGPRFEHLSAAVTEYQQALAAAETRAAEADEELHAVKAANTELAEQIARLTENLEGQKRLRAAEGRMVQGVWKSHEAQFADQKSALTAAEARIAELEKIAAKEKQRGDKLKLNVEATDIVLEDTRRDLARSESLSNERLTTCRSLQKQLTALQAKLAGLAGEIRGLNLPKEAWHSVTQTPLERATAVAHGRGWVFARNAAADLVAAAVGELC